VPPPIVDEIEPKSLVVIWEEPDDNGGDILKYELQWQHERTGDTSSESSESSDSSDSDSDSDGDSDSTGAGSGSGSDSEGDSDGDGGRRRSDAGVEDAKGEDTPASPRPAANVKAARKKVKKRRQQTKKGQPASASKSAQPPPLVPQEPPLDIPGYGAWSGWIHSKDVPADQLYAELDGLAPDIGLVFRVRAVNHKGPGEWSEPSQAMRPPTRLEYVCLCALMCVRSLVCVHGKEM